jgi:hypothetical protein
VRLAPRSEPEMLAAHAKARRQQVPQGSKPIARPRNLEAVLALGDTEFIQFRGRAYGVPPVPLQPGIRLTQAYATARETLTALGVAPNDPQRAAAYQVAVQKLPPLLWDLVRPVGRFRILCRWIGLHRNPFRDASEGELLELAAFFLPRRMRSGVQFLPMGHPQRRTSSTT